MTINERAKLHQRNHEVKSSGKQYWVHTDDEGFDHYHYTKTRDQIDAEINKKSTAETIAGVVAAGVITAAAACIKYGVNRAVGKMMGRGEKL